MIINELFHRKPFDQTKLDKTWEKPPEKEYNRTSSERTDKSNTWILWSQTTFLTSQKSENEERDKAAHYQWIYIQIAINKISKLHCSFLLEYFDAI